MLGASELSESDGSGALELDGSVLELDGSGALELDGCVLELDGSGSLEFGGSGVGSGVLDGRPRSFFFVAPARFCLTDAITSRLSNTTAGEEPVKTTWKDFSIFL